jgi:spore coat protein CotF|tara:strand:+ start:231 stop:422 length:192 start_codon:yes stop_codon:yes gene_type:complete
MPKEEKKKYLEDEFKTTIAKQVNAYLMEKGMTPLENADWLKKDDLLNIVRNFKIETETPLKKY